MPQDNTLGAPTEGLGQTVTFAADQAGPGAMQGLSYGQVRANSSGGNVPLHVQAQGLRPESQDHPIMNLVAQFADAATKAEAKRNQTEAFFQGMQKAASGQAVADIANEQPWYSQIFGDTDVIEGARMYSSRTKVEALAATFEDKMPELASKSPEEANAVFREAIQGAMTGDAATDAAIMQSASSLMPTVLKRHAKEHYAYLQTEAATNQQAAWRAASSNIQARARNLARERDVGPADQTDFDNSLQNLKALMAPAPGQNVENWRTSVANFLEERAKAGDFHTLNGLRGRGGDDPDILSVLNARQREGVDAAIAAGENKQRIRYSYEWNNRLAEIETRASLPQEGDTASMIADRVDSINNEYRMATGSTTGLIPPAQRAALVSQNAKAIVHEQQRQAAEIQRRIERAQDKAERDAASAAHRRELAEAKAHMKGLYDMSIANGSIGVVIHAPGVNAKEAHDSFWDGWVRAGDKTGFLTQGQLSMMANTIRTNYVNPQTQAFLTGQIKTQMTSGEVTQHLRGAETNYRMLRDTNPTLANAYYGDMAPRMEAYIAARDANVPEAIAFKDHFMTSKGTPTIKQEDRVAAAGAAGNDDFLTKLGSWVGATVRMAPGQDTKLAQHLKPAADLWMRHNGSSPEEAYRKAYQANNNQTFEQVGGYVIPKDKNQTPLAMKLTRMELPGTGRPVATDNVNFLLRDAVAGVVFGDSRGTHKASDMDDITVVRLDTKPSDPPLIMVSGFKDGVPYNHLITHMNLAELAATGKTARSQDDYRANPDLVDLTNR